ncbi:hypothetical protein CK203_086010 [Vitis vinifera]|uniref:Uncharacterized protein n=1 Tax=Vitis vinifera TaxID=29760 RepID=A0A438DW17_VITVI|nr:hypothetical protein CK203_086010 [Vitis vinifera]
MLINTATSGIAPPQDEYSLHMVEADIGSKGVAKISNSDVCGIGRSSRTLPSSELQKQRKQGSALHVAYEHKGNFSVGSSDCSFYFVPPNYPNRHKGTVLHALLHSSHRTPMPSPELFNRRREHPRDIKWEPVIINMDDGYTQIFLKCTPLLAVVFDPDSEGQIEKLKEMDPINFETVS